LLRVFAPAVVALCALVASGAEALLMVRLLGIDTQTNISPMWVPGPGFGWYGVYSGWYAVPQVTQYQIAVVETTLFDTQTRRLVWSGTSETFNPTSVQKDAPGFADLIVSTLQKSGLLPAAK
jgi:opacity protein-like surface antigen